MHQILVVRFYLVALGKSSSFSFVLTSFKVFFLIWKIENAWLPATSSVVPFTVSAWFFHLYRHQGLSIVTATTLQIAFFACINSLFYSTKSHVLSPHPSLALIPLQSLYLCHAQAWNILSSLCQTALLSSLTFLFEPELKSLLWPFCASLLLHSSPMPPVCCVNPHLLFSMIILQGTLYIEIVHI